MTATETKQLIATPIKIDRRNGHIYDVHRCFVNIRDDAVADRITTAVNSHARLLDALRSLTGEKMPTREDFEEARAAIADAEGR